jgi:hypothetical protein
VTAGGLICCHEAILNVGTKPYISLVGYLPDAPFPQPGGTASPFRGCVTLNNMVLTATRVSWIMSSTNWNTPAANIGLLHDKNTAMSTREIAAFQAALGVALAPGQVVDAAFGRADSDQYLRDFQQFVNIKSIIISAAPVHGKRREELISAANDYVSLNAGPPPVRICYPLQGFQNTGGTNTPICEEIELHLTYRWFCRLDLDDKVPDHSTFSVNRHGRFRASDLFRQVSPKRRGVFQRYRPQAAADRASQHLRSL